MIEYRENTKYRITALSIPLQRIRPYMGDDDIRLLVSFYTPNPRAFSNSERGQTRERQKYVTDLDRILQ